MFAADASAPRLDRMFNHLVGWACVALGMFIIAAIVITPAWIDLQQAKWEKGFIELCARAQNDQVTAYEEFAGALHANDPVLLERLAFHHLRRKATGGTVVSFDESDRIAGPYMAFDDKIEFAGRTWTEDVTRPARVDRSLVEQWLHRPMPVVGVDYPAFTKPENTLVRLATGPRRWLLLGVGGMMLFGGLMFPGPRQNEESDDEDAVAASVATKEAVHVAAPLADLEDEHEVVAELDEVGADERSTARQGSAASIATTILARS